MATTGADAVLTALNAGFTLGFFCGAAALYLGAILVRWWRERA